MRFIKALRVLADQGYQARSMSGRFACGLAGAAEGKPTTTPYEGYIGLPFGGIETSRRWCMKSTNSRSSGIVGRDNPGQRHYEAVCRGKRDQVTKSTQRTRIRNVYKLCWPSELEQSDEVVPRRFVAWLERSGPILRSDNGKEQRTTDEDATTHTTKTKPKINVSDLSHQSSPLL